ncbi:hypothetical protein ES702_01925 [subsurface metagenome]
MAQQFIEIGTTPDVFFWALIEFKKKLYAGTYKLTGPKAYSYPPWTYLKTFDAGESIMEFAIFNNELYAATEKKGYIYRMNSEDPTDWERVYDDAYLFVLNIKLFNGYLYAFICHTDGNSKVVRSSNGDDWSTVANWSNLFLHDSVIYDNEFYLVGNKNDPHRIWAKKTSNGTTWIDAPELCSDNVDGQWAPGAVSWRGKMWIGRGEMPSGLAKIYKYDGSTRAEVFSRTAPQPGAIAIFENKIFATFVTGWKQVQTNYLYWSPTGETGTWKHIKTWTDKADARSMGNFNKQLYLGIGNSLKRMLTPGFCAFV